MKKIGNWDKVKAAGERVKLPAGGYEAKIIGAKVVSYKGSNGSFERLEIAVDITSGEYKDYYKKDFNGNNRDDKKWRGVAKFYVPTEDGSEKDEFTKSLFKGMTEAVEDSNSGYHWDWDETTLKGLKVGILVRDEEYDVEGNRGFSPKVFKFIAIDKIKEGKFTTPAPKMLKNITATSAVSAPAQTETADDDYPF